MIGDQLHVRATFFRREQVVVQFRRGAWVADHPVNIFGYGKGPTPGDLLLGALTASSVLTIAAEAPTAGGCPPVVRAVAKTGRRPTDGPLPSILRIDHIVRRTELRGATAGQRRLVERALQRCPVVRSLSSGVVIDEIAHLDRSSSGPGPHEPNATPAGVSASRGAATSGALAMDAPEEFGPYGYHWVTSAVQAGRTIAMVQLAPSTHICDTDPGESAMGPSPLEVLLAFVAAGSATFVARFSAQQDIPVRRIDIAANATVEVTDDGVEVIRSIHKELTIVGDLTDQQFRDVQFFSAHSAGTETARHGAQVQDEVVALPAGYPTTAADALLDIAQLTTTGSLLAPR